MSLRDFLDGKPTTERYNHINHRHYSERVYISEGVPVHPLRPSNNVAALRLDQMERGVVKPGSDTDVLLRAADDLRDDFARKINQIAHGFKIFGDNIKFRPPKDPDRMRAKEENPQDAARNAGDHTDLLGAKLYIKNAPIFQRVTDYFRPDRNADAVQLKAKSENPDENGYAGNMVKVAIPTETGVPFIGEVILLTKSYKDYDDKTHHLMDQQRLIADVLTRNHAGETTVSLCKIFENSVRERLATNQAAFKPIHSLQQERHFRMIEGTPVLFARDGRKDDNEKCIVPDARTGFYRTENAYLGRQNDGQSCTREQFLRASMEIVPRPDVAKSGLVLPSVKLVTPAPVSAIA